MEVNYPKSKLPIALYLVQADTIALFRIIAAKAAFWDLSGSELQDLAFLWGIDLDTAESLAHILFIMIRAILELKDADAIEVVASRLALKDLHNTFISDLLQVDEAIAFYDFNDQQDVHTSQENAKKEIERRTDFAHAYGQLRATYGRTRAARADFKYLCTIEHADMKKYLPPGATIWRGPSHKCTCGHFPPRKRIHTPWDVGGEAFSVTDVTRRLWEQYLEWHALPRSACNVKGLWDD